MKKLAAVMFVAGALVLAATVPGQARESHDGHARAAVEHRRGDDHRGFEGHRGFGRGGVFVGVAPSFGWGAAYRYGGYVGPSYAYAPPQTPSYYCPTYGAYYPSVATCPVPWVPTTP